MRLMSEHARLVVVLAVAFGCHDGTDSPAGEAPGAPVEADSDAGRRKLGVPLQDLVDAGRRRPPGTELAVLDRMEEPLRVDERFVQNRHDPAREDVVRTYVYDDLSFSVYAVSSTGKEILQRVEVTGPGYRSGDGLRVGMTREAVVGIRGQPDRASADADIYQIGGPMPAQLRLAYGADDTVRQMVWVFPVD